MDGAADRRVSVLWPGLAIAVFAVLYVGEELLRVGGDRVAVDADDLANLFSPVVATLCCLATARRRDNPRARRVWLLFGASAACWALGQAAWVGYEVVAEVAVPFPGLPDIGYVASVPPLVGAMLLIASGSVSVAARVRAGLDGLIVAFALLEISWWGVLRAALDAGGPSDLGIVVGLFYPVADAVIVALLMLVLARQPKLRAQVALIAGWLLLSTLGHALYAYGTSTGGWQPGNVIDACWGVGFLLLALAAHLTPGVGPAQGSAAPAAEPALRVRALTHWLPYVPLCVALPIGILDLTGARPDRVLQALGVATFVCVLGRQLLALRENAAVSSGLEREVSVRTEALRRAGTELERQALHDPLTGLGNRLMLAQELEHALATLASGRRAVGVALLDLDGFKAVNDTFGHGHGDALLQVLADRLRAVTLPGEVVSRLGGDEFAFVLRADGPGELLAAGERILGALREPLVVEGRPRVVTGSVGLAAARRGDRMHNLLRDADVAMYAAKDAGKDRVRLFEPTMFEAVRARVELEADLRAALAIESPSDQLSLFYQPVVDLADNVVRGVESLVRWRHPVRGVVPPSRFVGVAEEGGLIVPLGRRVLHEAIAQACRWQAAGHELSTAVNVSARQLADPQLVDEVVDELSAAGLHPARLVVEITETALLQDSSQVVARLHDLRDAGVRVALDDFGTGYSSLHYLASFPIDVLKIDRSFVAALASPGSGVRSRADTLTRAVVRLGADLGLEVVAEGVETGEQAEALRSMGCRRAQGYLFARPAPAEATTALLDAGGLVPGGAGTLLEQQLRL